MIPYLAKNKSKYCEFSTLMILNSFVMEPKNIRIMNPMVGLLLPEVPILDIVIETDVISAAELGQDFQNLVLLFWRDHVFTMMDSVVWPIATTKG